MSAPEFELPAEWSPILLALRSWGGTFTEYDCVGYQLILGDLDPAVVLEGIRRLGRSGRKFYPRPSAAEVGDECDVMLRPELAQVSWVEVWSAFRAAVRSSERPRGLGMAANAVFVGERVGAELGPVAASWAAASFERAHQLPVDDPTYGHSHLAQLRSTWEQHEDVQVERLRRGGVVRTPAELVAGEDRVPAISQAPAAHRLLGGAS